MADPSTASTNGATKTSVRLDAKVVTEDTLEASVNGHVVVEVDARTIVTPTGRDWLRRRNVELIRGNSSTTSVAAEQRKPAGVAIVQTSSDAVEKAIDHFASSAGWRQERVGSREDAVRLARAAATGDTSPVVVISAEPEAVACDANRDPKIRAAVIDDAATVGRVKESMQGNLFVVSPSGRSFFELRHLLHSLI